ncbi:ubiquinone biosynthesis monooxygenase COQ6, mitochondrial isoform X2 [Anthonomus grandis grandis]|uniref:ubiquinone biosynthesis monooxygenase COQ6, mitochondrial isoform X2 n=1 Tax=Anthonomus grandis grandis TaxID=2921223 RepID=UPI002165C9EB|nr:ubiquinone biosynthesis monooxygenase COQ6, mitochondrial isoform X2 [Anthonomus grandis grandis]
MLLNLYKIRKITICCNAEVNFMLKRHFSNNVTKHYDIVIAGGGMVGTTLACTLGKNKKLTEKKILLLEASKNKPWTLPEKYSNRVVSLNPGTRTLLNSIGAWKNIEKSRFATVKRLQVWDALSDTTITFGQPELTETVSYIVENDLLLSAVAEETKNCQNVTIQYDARVKEYTLPEYSEKNVKIQLENGDEYTCDLLLGCDGVNSSVRKAMQADYLSWSYHQMGVVATLKLSEPIKNEIAWQRFLPTGPVALLPLTDDMSSLVWSTTVQEAKRLLGLSDEEFVDELNRAIYGTFSRSSLVLQATSAFDTFLRFLNCGVDEMRQFPPKIKTIETGSRAGFPLGFGHSSQYIGKGVALVGDAAHRIHPLAGQGVNLGFGDVTCLNDILGKAVYSGSTINDLGYLREYESERQKHNVTTMAAIEGLHRLYTTDLTPVVLLRSLGLQFTHALAPLKKKRRCCS